MEQRRKLFRQTRCLEAYNSGDIVSPHRTPNTIMALHPPNSTKHDSSIWNLNCYIDKEYKCALVSTTTNIVPCISKCVFNRDMHQKWSNYSWDTPWILDAQIPQVLKPHYGWYLMNYCIMFALKQNISMLWNKQHGQLQLNIKCIQDASPNNQPCFTLKQE